MTIIEKLLISFKQQFVNNYVYWILVELTSLSDLQGFEYTYCIPYYEPKSILKF